MALDANVVNELQSYLKTGSEISLKDIIIVKKPIKNCR